MRNALILLAQARAALASARAAVDFNRQKLDAEQKKLGAGTSTPYNVILAQRDLMSAQLAQVQAGVDYAKALVERDRATGVLLEKRKIDLDRAIQSPVAANTGAGTPAPTP